MDSKQLAQDQLYKFPYHYLVNLDQYQTHRNLNWGIEYFGYMNHIRQILTSIQHTTLLDVGCGDGAFIHNLGLANPTKTYVGYDTSESAIFLAKGINYRVENTIFVHAPVSECLEEFDVVTAIEVLEHLPDDEVQSICDDIASRVSEGGYLIISVPSINIYPVKDKHYRHYRLEMILETFPSFDLVQADFLVKHGRLFRTMCRLSNRFCGIKLFNKFALWMGRNFLFNATADDGRHIVAVLKNSTPELG